MNITEAMQSILNPTVSPLPDDIKTKAIKFAMQQIGNQIKTAPEDIYRSTPPGDVLNKIALAKKYNLQDLSQSPPYQAQVGNSLDTANHGIRAAIDALAVGGALRPFTQDPLSLINGQRAQLLNSGKGFSIFDQPGY